MPQTEKKQELILLLGKALGDDYLLDVFAIKPRI